MQRERVHHLTDRLTTGTLSLGELTGNIIGTYFFGIGQADILRTQDMRDFRAGFDWVIGGDLSPSTVCHLHIQLHSLILIMFHSCCAVVRALLRVCPHLSPPYRYSVTESRHLRTFCSASSSIRTPFSLGTCATLSHFSTISSASYLGMAGHLARSSAPWVDKNWSASMGEMIALVPAVSFTWPRVCASHLRPVTCALM